MTQEELAALSEAATQSEPAWNVFAQALVSAYRANQLVLIGPDAEDKVARAIQDVMPQWLAENGTVDDNGLATAALAALGVK